MKPAIARLLVAASLVLTGLLGPGSPAHGAGTLTSATVRLWPLADIANTVGFNPTESDDDVKGLTGHVATSTAQLTVVTLINNAFAQQPAAQDEGLTGLIFWNPQTNVFKWYLVEIGYSASLDINTGAPSFYGPAGDQFGAPIFGPGDVWASVEGPLGTPKNPTPTPLYVNFKGTNNFRHYQVPGAGLNGVAVDQTTGYVFFTDRNAGTINQLDPKTNMVTTWLVGGVPHYLAIDSWGKVFATVARATLVAGGQDAVVRLDPTTNQVTAWPVPGGFDQFDPVAAGSATKVGNGIDIDGQGNVWFVETKSNEVARLEPSTNTITEFTKAGVNEPQQIAAAGSGANLQVFFTEANGESVSVVTPQHPGTPVTPIPNTLVPTEFLTLFFDSIRTPQQTTIQPTDFPVPAVDPEITRFTPMPAPPAPTGNDALPRNPGGLTDVTQNGVLGAYFDPLFAGNSAVFRVIPQPAPANPPPGQAAFQKVTGGGWIPADNTRATFGFNVQRKQSTDPVQGQLQYVNHANGDNVHSVQITDLQITRPTATFSGTCTNRGAPCTFKVTVTDGGSAGSADSFSITGTGITPASGTLRGGNIVIH
jgi:streptogramin lyase